MELHSIFVTIGEIYFVGCLISFVGRDKSDEDESDTFVYALLWPIRLVKRAKEMISG